MSDAEIKKIQKELEELQYRMGGAEYIIRLLVQRMHPNEIASLKEDVNAQITTYGANTPVEKIMNEALRLLG